MFANLSISSWIDWVLAFSSSSIQSHRPDQTETEPCPIVRYCYCLDNNVLNMVLIIWKLHENIPSCCKQFECVSKQLTNCTKDCGSQVVFIQSQGPKFKKVPYHAQTIHMLSFHQAIETCHTWIQITFVVSFDIIVWLLLGCCWLVLWRRALFLLFSLRCYHLKHCFIFIFTLCLIPLHQYMSKHSVETVIQEPNHQSNWDFSKESYALLWKPLNSRLCLVTNNLSVVS